MARTFARVLVPTDFSEHSDAALDYARTFAAKFGASLHVLHVFDDPYSTAAALAGETYSALPGDLRETYASDAMEKIAAQLASRDMAGVTTTSRVFMGAAARTIVDYAAAEHVDLIVMGTHGRTGVRHLLLGSVAEHVVRTAGCPVLTVHAETAVPAVQPVAAQVATA